MVDRIEDEMEEDRRRIEPDNRSRNRRRFKPGDWNDEGGGLWSGLALASPTPPTFEEDGSRPDVRLAEAASGAPLAEEVVIGCGASAAAAAAVAGGAWASVAANADEWGDDATLDDPAVQGSSSWSAR